MDAGKEVCDDGNRIDNDGCSADCQTVEDGWECPTWGQPCRKICGNGVVDTYTLSTGVVVTEECDLGNSDDNALSTDTNSATKSLNTAASDVYNLYACTDTCEVSNSQLWQCVTDSSTKLSTCNYLCGNNVPDFSVGEACD